MQKDMELCFQKLGIEYDICWFPFKAKHNPDEFRQKIHNAIKGKNFDAVFSINFREEVAECANEAGIPYISWVVDSPFGVTQAREKLNLPTNHIFVFDRWVCDKLSREGVNTVIHMPLAVNVPRIDQIQLSSADHKRLGSDISFVGSLYPSSFVGFRKSISEEEGIWVEDVILKQQALQGEYRLDALTSGPMLERLRKTLRDDGEEMMFHEGLQSILAKEITRRDRLTMLMVFSEFYETALFSPEPDALLSKVSFRGTVESFEELFKVYKASKINLNVTFRRIVSGIPLRVLEVLGAGGFLLTNWQEEVAENFRDGEELVMYRNLEEAIDKASYYLSHERERQLVEENGHNAVKRFSYENQWNKMTKGIFYA